MSTYKLTDEALQDLDEIFQYLSGYSLDAVDRFLDALEKNPKICSTTQHRDRIVWLKVR